MPKTKAQRSYKDQVRDLAARLAVDPSAPEEVRADARKALRPSAGLDKSKLTPDEREALRVLLSKAAGRPMPWDHELSVQLVRRPAWSADGELERMDVSEAELLAALPVNKGTGYDK